jgi:hypothetical protein
VKGVREIGLRHWRARAWPLPGILIAGEFPP